MSDSKQFIYRIGEDIVINEAQFSITRNDLALKLRRKSFQVLIYLIKHRHRVVTNNELLEAIWPDTFQTHTVVAQSLKDIREVLGDEARNSRFVETLRGTGYRFVGELVESEFLPPVDHRVLLEPTLEGAFLVGAELRRHEEANEHRSMETAEAHSLDPDSYRITPENSIVSEQTLSGSGSSGTGMAVGVFKVRSLNECSILLSMGPDAQPRP